MSLLRRRKDSLPKARTPEELSARIAAALEWLANQPPKVRREVHERKRHAIAKVIDGFGGVPSSPQTWPHSAKRLEKSAGRQPDLAGCAALAKAAEELRARAPKAFEQEAIRLRASAARKAADESPFTQIIASHLATRRRCAICGTDLSVAPAMVDNRTGKAYCYEHRNSMEG